VSRRLELRAVLIVGTLVIPSVGPAPLLRAAEATIPLAGRWTIDTDHSEFPAEIGFDTQVEAVAQGSASSTTSTRNRGGRSGGAASSLTIAHEGEQTLKIIGDVTDEAEHPWPVLTIGEADDVVTMSDGAAQTRRFHPGKDDEQRLADGGITTHAKWDKNAFVVDYEVEKDRNVRYTYSRASGTAPLVVEVSFRDHGHGDTVRRTYLPDK
jgi:endo-alpha-1,4-polygalactosaminidase (GH114 family)